MRGLLFIPIILMTACSQAPEGQINDPYEAANRRVHAFNVGLDQNIVKPMTAPLRSGDQARKPGIGTVALMNFGSNLSLPGKVVNSVLQGRPEPAVKNTFRFLINTTLGFAGLADPASADFGLPEIDTDFGETLHVWGVPEGAYLELPVLGPSTERDAVGKVVDWVIDPLDSVLNKDQGRVATAAKVGAKLAKRARFGGTVDSVLHDSADSYAQARLLYLMHRRHELGQEAETIDPYAE